MHPLSAAERAHHRRKARRDDGDWSGAECDEETGQSQSLSKKRQPKDQAPASPNPVMALPQQVVMLPPAATWPHAALPGGGAGLPLHVGMAPPGAVGALTGGLSMYSNAAFADNTAQQMQQQQQQLIALATAIVQQQQQQQQQSQQSPPPFGSHHGGSQQAASEWPHFSPPGRGHTSRGTTPGPGSPSTRAVGKTRREALRSLVRELEEAAADEGEGDDGSGDDGSRHRYRPSRRTPRRTRDGGADSDGEADAGGKEGRGDANGRVRSSAGAPELERRRDGMR